MKPMRWALQHKTSIATVLGTILFIVAGFWFWGVLVEYIDPRDVTDRKDVVQVFALIVAGVVGFLGAIVGIVNLSVSRRNLQQQIELEDQRRASMREIEDHRTQEGALQAYFEQMGGLLTDHNLVSTDREDIRQLAEAQTLTVLARLDGFRKRPLVRFLHGAGLINKDKPIVEISGADLRYAHLSHADLSQTDLSYTDLSTATLHGANLSTANLKDADLSSATLSHAILTDAKVSHANLFRADLSRANLFRADLSSTDLSKANVSDANLSYANLKGANLSYADLSRADLRDANLSRTNLAAANLTGANLTGVRGLTYAQISKASSLKGATMADGQPHKD
jgi:uncharacterized protein YjbI with pentapeptide repeats